MSFILTVAMMIVVVVMARDRASSKSLSRRFLSLPATPKYELLNPIMHSLDIFTTRRKCWRSIRRLWNPTQPTPRIASGVEGFRGCNKDQGLGGLYGVEVSSLG